MLVGMALGWWLARRSAEQLGPQLIAESEPQSPESVQMDLMEEPRTSPNDALRERNAASASSSDSALASSSAAACRTPPRAPSTLQE